MPSGEHAVGAKHEIGTNAPALSLLFYWTSSWLIYRGLKPSREPGNSKVLESMLVDDPHSRGILVVDDVDAVRETVTFILRAAGFKSVLTACDGVDALMKIKEFGDQIYIVVLDLLMPRMGGLDFFRKLACSADFPIGVVVMTGYASAKTREEFFQLGTEQIIAVNYFSKPCQAQQLLDEVTSAAELVHKRRLKVSGANAKVIFEEVGVLKKAVNSLHVSVTNLAALNADFRQTAATSKEVQELKLSLEQLRGARRGFLAELGMDVVRAAVLALGILGVLYLGLGDLLRELAAKLGS